MSTTEIKQGTELDLAVAREVMGWTNLHQPYGVGWWGIPPGKTKVNLVWPFSAAINAAWEIIEHFGSSYVSLIHGYGEVNGERVDGWWCEIVAPGQWAKEFGTTVEVAICQAALAAVRSMNNVA